ncbi:hypothetical protein ACET3Z_004128 [Daucus carota]
MATSKVHITLKVVFHKQEQRVLFAEASSDFVDILFSFLTLPMGTIVRLLSKHPKTSRPPGIGSLNNLYRSIANLDAKYFTSGACKDILLNTRNSAADECENLKINIDDKPVEYFTCEDMECTERSHTPSFSLYKGVVCKNCAKMLKKNARYLNGTRSDERGVFVEPAESFVITDDLHVIPNIPASTIAILENSGFTDFGVLKEKTFEIGYTEMLDLLKYSILSKTPLTNMFLRKNNRIMNNLVQTFNCPIKTDGINSFKNMTVKVLVQKSSKKILLAHCTEDFIDFLFSFLAVPLGRVISMLSKNNEPALCVQNIHQSVSELKVGEFLKSQEKKEMLICPQLSMLYLFSKQLFKDDKFPKLYGSPSTLKEYYYLSSYDDSSSREMILANPTGEKGFLKGPEKFMVTDDLVVTLFTTMSCLKYVQSCGVPPNDSEEQVISIGTKEAVSLLTASLVSTSVLTNGLKHLILSKPKTERLVKKLKLDN